MLNKQGPQAQACFCLIRKKGGSTLFEMITDVGSRMASFGTGEKPPLDRLAYGIYLVITTTVGTNKHLIWMTESKHVSHAWEWHRIPEPQATCEFAHEIASYPCGRANPAGTMILEA